MSLLNKPQGSLKRYLVFVAWFGFINTQIFWCHAGDMQRNLGGVEAMPNIPVAFTAEWDWRQKAIDYDTYAFNRDATATYKPLWWDNTNVNGINPGFGLPSYAQWIHGGPGKPAEHEAYATMGSVLGSTLAGIDKSNQDGIDYVAMCRNYLNTANGENIFLMWTSTRSGQLFWTDLYPNIMAYGLKHHYGNRFITDAQMAMVASRWADCVQALGGSAANFNWQAFRFETMTGVTQNHIQPDAAAGIAFLTYLAYMHYGNPSHLQAADWSLQWFERRAEQDNPLYENILPYGAYACARMNAEQGRNYNLHRLLNWCFGQTTIEGHGDWGMITKNFGPYGAHGLVGMRQTSEYYDGYAFAMDTFSFVPPLVALVRYDNRYARAIGKWMSHVLNNARLFYPEVLPADQQSNYAWVTANRNDPARAYCYEGLKCNFDGKNPYAGGDPTVLGWGPNDIAFYGSSHVGMLGGLALRTNNPYIWQIDCLKTDYFRRSAYPTYLYYNPHGGAAWVQIDLGTTPTMLYDQVSNRFVATDQNRTTGIASFLMPPDSAMVLVLVPDQSSLVVNENKTRINGRIVDYVREDPLPKTAADPATTLREYE